MNSKQIEELLQYVPAGLPWTEWRSVIAAVRNAAGNDADAARLLEAWDPIDARSVSYAHQLRTCTLKTSPGYLVNLAKAHGYKPAANVPTGAVRAKLVVESEPQMTTAGTGFYFTAISLGGKHLTAWASVTDGAMLKRGDRIEVVGLPKASGAGIFFVIYQKI